MINRKSWVVVALCLIENCNSFTLLRRPTTKNILPRITTTPAIRTATYPSFHNNRRIQPSSSSTRKSHLQAVTSVLSFLPTKAQSLVQLPFIGSTDTWGNVAAMVGTASIAQYVGKTTKIGKLLGPPVTAMAIAFALASIGIINPGGTVAAKSLQLLTLQLATPLLLLGADLRDCVSRCGPMLQAFLTAALATLLASMVGWKVCSGALQQALGPQDGLIIAAALMAKNIGGGINYIAVCRSLSASPAAIAAGLCVDNLFALVYFPITSALSAGRPDLPLDTPPPNSSHVTSPTNNQDSATVSIEQATMVLFLASSAIWLGERFGGPTASLPLCTLLTVLFASRAPPTFLQPLQPAAHVMGTVCLYLFFATAGAPGIAVAESVRSSMLPLGSFLTILYGIHGSILTLAYKLSIRRRRRQQQRSQQTMEEEEDTIKQTTKNNSNPFLPQRLLVASSAAIGGPATAVALAQANKWESLVAPCLLVGNIGYAIATFAGLAFVALCK